MEQQLGDVYAWSKQAVRSRNPENSCCQDVAKTEQFFFLRNTLLLPNFWWRGREEGVGQTGLQSPEHLLCFHGSDVFRCGV